MTDRRQTHFDGPINEIDCPVCDAKKGDPCGIVGDKFRSVHMGRVSYYWATHRKEMNEIINETGPIVGDG